MGIPVTDLDGMMNISEIEQALTATMLAIGAEFTSPRFYVQFVIILVGLVSAWMIGKAIRRRVAIASTSMGWPIAIRLMFRALINNSSYVAFALLMLAARLGMLAITWPSRSHLIAVAAKLAAALIAIKIATSVVRNAFVVNLLTGSLGALAALSIIGQLETVVAALGSVGFDIGDLRITPLLFVKLIALMAITVWSANITSNLFEDRIRRSKDMTPSVQVLLSKLVRVVLLTMAAAMTLDAVGINLAALAIFSGAIGVGIGFGLQKIVSNFISGMILLADKSVKPGDLISLGDNRGRITAMNTRFISIAAGDGRVILIPNEDLITQKVVNWTYTDKNTMVRIPFSANFDANPRRICDLAIEVASASPRIMEGKVPVCQLLEFTETGINYVLTLWISDPDGLGETRSDVMTRLWEAFGNEGFKAPHPVREIRVRDGRSLPAEPITPALMASAGLDR